MKALVRSSKLKILIVRRPRQQIQNHQKGSNKEIRGKIKTKRGPYGTMLIIRMETTEYQQQLGYSKILIAMGITTKMEPMRNKRKTILGLDSNSVLTQKRKTARKLITNVLENYFMK